MGRAPEVVHRIMAKIRSKDTGPEIKLRKALWSLGFRYRVNVKDLPGRPDLVFRKAKVAVFCDGDYWHGHNWALRGLSSLAEELEGYAPYWRAKIQRNVTRDLVVTDSLKALGFTVLRFWASDIERDLAKCLLAIQKALP
ncbi:MAG: very short patch repair endonuclease [Deltaproteobacteria bacterium]|jgi:DNA mismatch endonuclease (patch repair protein)|nr:very short patch repair endonuclease [Deltaproteobacteria bacterium]